MALDIEQIAAAAYPAVLAERKKPANQWAENAALRELERQGCMKALDYGENIEVPLDYRQNPDGGVMASDQEQSTLLKTEVITSAVYDIAQISYWVTWTKGDDAKTPNVNEKIDFTGSLLENGIQSHDDLLEQCIFTTSAAGGVEVNGLDVLVPDSGQGSPGGINAAVETFWQNFSDTYTDSTDIEAALTEAYNTAAKGSGASLSPKFILSGPDAQATYEAALQAFQRFVNKDEADGGFKVLAFKNCRWVFSQYGDDHIYLLNPKNYQFTYSKKYFRDKGTTERTNGQNSFNFPIYSAVQALTNNKSRLAVLSL